MNCKETGRQYRIDQEGQKLLERYQKLTEDYFKSRAVDGKITTAEVLDVYKGLMGAAVEEGLKKQDEIDNLLKHDKLLEETVRESDDNSDGYLDLEEFKSFSNNFKSKWFSSLMDDYDLNGDGIISRDEVAIVLDRMKDHPSLESTKIMFDFVFDNFDADGDGKISLQEWTSAYRSLRW